MLAYVCENHSQLGTGRLPSPCGGDLRWDFTPRGRARPGYGPQSEDTAGLGGESPAGNMWATASAQDRDIRMADIGKVLGIDIWSGQISRVQVK